MFGICWVILGPFKQLHLVHCGLGFYVVSLLYRSVQWFWDQNQWNLVMSIFDLVVITSKWQCVYLVYNFDFRYLIACNIIVLKNIWLKKRICTATILMISYILYIFHHSVYNYFQWWNCCRYCSYRKGHRPKNPFTTHSKILCCRRNPSRNLDSELRKQPN